MSTELSSTVLQSILEFTTALSRTAGKLILEGSEAIQASGTFDEKKNSVDLVTEYDVRVEELVKKALGEKYPGYNFIGEESYAAGARPPLTDEPTFCVDPIDGTTNFVHGFPFVCISLGLIYKRQPVLGVIYNPFLDHLYYGVKGQGSYLVRNNGPALRLPLTKEPKPLSSLSAALMAIEWGSDRTETIVGARSRTFHRLAGDPAQGVQGGRMGHSLRSVGSAALNYAIVAQGGLDLYWEIGCYPWDVCAGIVIAQEAGGLVSGSHDLFNSVKDTPALGEVGEELLTGRKYLVVRGIGGPNGGKEAQKKIMEDFYATAEDYEPSK